MIRFLYSFAFDDAAITSSSESGDLLDDNVVTDFVAEKWRTTGVTSEWIRFDLGSAQQVNCVGLYGHNLSAGTTITLQANSSDDFADPPFSEGLTWHGTRITHCFAPQTYRWWRLVLADADNPDGYLEIGRIAAGVFLEPGVNYRDDYRRIRRDPSEKLPTAGRQNYHRQKQQYWEYRLYFEALPGADQSLFETMFEAVGTHHPLVVMLDPEDHPSSRSIFGEITRDFEFSGRLVGAADVSLAIEEKN